MPTARHNIGWVSEEAVALTSNTTIGQVHYGKVITNRGASSAIVLTLADVASGLDGTHFKYRGVADQDVTFTANTSGELIVIGDGSADSLTIDQTGKKVGASVGFYCDGTSWFASIEESLGSPSSSSGITGEIKMYGGSSAPSGWLFCDGGTQLIADYPDLSDVLGTTYGGNGTTTFGIPDLRGRMPMHEGAGAGLTSRSLGDSDGDENKTIAEANLPAHTHTQPAQSGNGNLDAPNNAYPAAHTAATHSPYHSSTNGVNMAATGSTGSGTALDVMNPYLVVNFIIKT